MTCCKLAPVSRSSLPLHKSRPSTSCHSPRRPAAAKQAGRTRVDIEVIALIDNFANSSILIIAGYRQHRAKCHAAVTRYHDIADCASDRQIFTDFQQLPQAAYSNRTPGSAGQTNAIHAAQTSGIVQCLGPDRFKAWHSDALTWRSDALTWRSDALNNWPLRSPAQ